MGKEIDLLRNYPRAKRDVKRRGMEKTEEDRAIAREFGRDFFDGERKYGYGGFEYDPRFWRPVIPDLIAEYGLSRRSSVLDIGCAKGFMLHDLQEMVPGINVAGIDISDYAIENCIESVKDLVQVGSAVSLPYDDNVFDLVISINTIHNLEVKKLVRALSEIDRVTKKDAFVTVDAYRNQEEKEAMMAWNLTARTILSVEEWVDLFLANGYSGDYYWFTP